MSQRDSFSDWAKQFQESLKGRAALEQLERAFPKAEGLRDVVLASCYSAAMFTRQGDPARAIRKEIARAQKRRKVQAKLIRVLRLFLRQLPNASQNALNRVIGDLSSRGISIDKPPEMTSVQVFDAFLHSYADRLEDSRSFLPPEPAWDLFTYGCFFYPFERDAAKRHNVPKQTMLIFDLVQLFRLRSQGILERTAGTPMPDDGKPHFYLAAALVNATLGGQMITEDARNRLRAFVRNNPGTCIFPWPHAPAQYDVKMPARTV